MVQPLVSGYQLDFVLLLLEEQLVGMSLVSVVSFQL